MQPCCGNANLYCPPGSITPSLVAKGFYSKGPDDAHRHSEQQCEEGFFCVGGIKNKCPSGFQCPTLGLSSPVPCGHTGVLCDEGSIQPTKVRDGYFSIGGTNTTRQGQQIAPMGFYAFEGILRSCSSGHYGSTFLRRVLIFPYFTSKAIMALLRHLFLTHDEEINNWSS